MVHTEFNWLWYHVPTSAPYKVEGIFSPLILAHGNTAQSAKTAAIVLQSLTLNSQNVFRILAEYINFLIQMKAWQPIIFLECLGERFFVNSYLILNSHLTEFKDHELVKTRRNSDGQDCLYIPLAPEALQQLFLELNQ